MPLIKNDGKISALKGSVQFDWVAPYTGDPSPGTRFYLHSEASGSLNNAIILTQRTTAGGALQLKIYGPTGSLLLDSILDNFSAVTGTTYRFFLNWDFDTGNTYVEVDSVLSGSKKATTYAPSAAGIDNIVLNAFHDGTFADGESHYENFQMWGEAQDATQLLPAFNLHQLLQIPASGIFGANFNTDFDINWRPVAGSRVGKLNGVPTLVGGKLVCTGTQGVYYDENSKPLETHKFKYTPSYTGAAPSNVNLFSAWAFSSNNNRILLYQQSSSSLKMALAHSGGGDTIAAGTDIGGAFNAVAGTEYEFELNVDSVSGVVRLFIDGVLHGTLSPGTWTRSSIAMRNYMGASPAAFNSAEGSFDDYIMFDNVQHTVGYTPGYSVVNFAEAVANIPDFVYSGAGAIQDLLSFAATETGVPTYIIDDQYWNGAAWVASNGTRAQSSPKADIIANLATLSIIDSSNLSIDIAFTDTDTQGAVSNMDVGYNGQIISKTGTLVTSNPFITNEITDFDTEEVLNDVDNYIGYAILVNVTDLFWYDGAAWVPSDGSRAQTNSATVIEANIGTLVADNVGIQLYIFLESDDQISTPQIDNALFTHNFGALNPAPPLRCETYGYLTDLTNAPVVGATVEVKLMRSNSEYAEASDYLIASSVSKVTDNEGFFAFALIRSSEYETAADPMKYVLSITLPDEDETEVNQNGVQANTLPQEIEFEVPDLISVNITDQIGAI